MAMAITGATVVAPGAAVALRDVSKLSMSSSSSGTASFFSSFRTQGTTPPHVMIRASGIRSKVTRVVAVRPAASHEADPGAEVREKPLCFWIFMHVLVHFLLPASPAAFSMQCPIQLFWKERTLGMLHELLIRSERRCCNGNLHSSELDDRKLS